MILKRHSAFNTQVRSLGQFLNDFMTSSRLTIPNDYQREYAWGKEQIETLIDDIKELIEEEDSYLHLGKIAISKINRFQTNIVDGQQRLTTLFMIIHYLSFRSENPIKIKKLYYDEDERNGFILNYSSDSYNKNLKLLGSEFNQSSLHKGYEIIIDLIEDVYSKDLLKQILDNIQIDVQYLDPEYQLHYFEDINNKGVQLNKIDIIKNNIRNNFINCLEFDKIWEDIIHSLTKIPDDIFKRSQSKSKFEVLLGWYNSISGNILMKYNEDLPKNHFRNSLLELLNLIKFTISVLAPEGKLYNSTTIRRFFSGYSFITYL